MTPISFCTVMIDGKDVECEVECYIYHQSGLLPKPKLDSGFIWKVMHTIEGKVIAVRIEAILPFDISSERHNYERHTR